MEKLSTREAILDFIIANKGKCKGGEFSVSCKCFKDAVADRGYVNTINCPMYNVNCNDDRLQAIKEARERIEMEKKIKYIEELA